MKLDAIRKLVQQFLDGQETRSIESIVSCHPELMPELECELKLAGEILAAGRSEHAALGERGIDDTIDYTNQKEHGLHIRCPHCRNAIELIDEQDSSDVSCPSCGSRVSLVTSSTNNELSRVGQFELLDQVGRGAFGVVWRAYDTVLDRTVAVKIPRASQMDAAEAERFLREARTAAQLKHPNIVSVYEVGRQNDTLFIVSDFVDGETLQDWSRAAQPSFHQTAQLCAQIANALHHAHESNVVHRDLKPSNIMIDAAGEPHIMDFGLAKREAAEITMTIDGQVLGTPAYMSPEQARGDVRETGRRTDIYSIGVILFELLTGELPFRGNVRMLIHQVIHDEPPSPSQLNSQIPKDLETICLKCLEKNPAPRFASADELCDELKRFLAGEPIQSRPISRIKRSVRWCRRYPLVAGLIAICLCLLVLFAGGIMATTWFALESERERKIAEAAETEALAAKEETDETLARSNFNLAYARWKSNQVQDALDLLDRIPPKYRQIEWGISKRYFRGYDIVLRGHSKSHVVKFSPDGSIIATGYRDGSIGLWDSITGRSRRVIRAHIESVESLLFADFGRKLVSANRDEIKIWDVQSGKELRYLDRLSHRVGDLGLATDGREQIFFCERGTDSSARFSSRISRWDLNDGTRQVLSMSIPNRLFYTLDFDTCSISDSASCIVMRFWDGSLKLFRRKTGTKTPLNLDLEFAGIIEISPDAKALVSSNRGIITLFDVNSGERQLTYREHSSEVYHMRFSRDGKIATGSRNGIVKIWDPKSGETMFTLRNDATVTDLDFSPDGQKLATVGIDGSVKVWDVQFGNCFEAFHVPKTISKSVAFSRQANRLVTGMKPSESKKGRAISNNAVVIWNVEEQERTSEISFDWPVTTASIARDATRLVSATRFVRGDGLLSVWDVGRQTLIWRANELGQSEERRIVDILQAEFDPNGNYVVSLVCLSPRNKYATSNVDHTYNISMWDAKSGEKLGTIESLRHVFHVSFSPDGSLIAAATEGEIRFWETQSLKQVDAVAIGARSFRFGPNNETVVAILGKVSIWDITKSQLVRSFDSHDAQVTDACLNSDGTRLLSADLDGTVKLWDAEFGQELLSIDAHEGRIEVLSFTNDGFITAGWDNVVRHWTP